MHLMLNPLPESGMEALKTTAVIGIGNTLMSDDGAGVRVLEHLDGLPEHVAVVELATGGMTLLHHLEKYRKVILVDAADFGGSAGEVRFFTPEEVSSIKTVGYSLHDLDIMAVLRLASQLGTHPESVIIAAVQPASLEMKEGLSDPVEKALPGLARKILEHAV